MEHRIQGIAKTLNRPRATIQHWVDKGLVEPDLTPEYGRGRGRALLFSERNLVEFGMVAVLQDEIGLDLGRVKVLMQTLRKGRIGEQHFEDFYENSAYGRDKEIACWMTPKGDEAEIVLIPKGEKFELTDLGGVACTLLLLGRLKLRGRGRVGLS